METNHSKSNKYGYHFNLTQHTKENYSSGGKNISKQFTVCLACLQLTTLMGCGEELRRERESKEKQGSFPSSLLLPSTPTLLVKAVFVRV